MDSSEENCYSAYRCERSHMFSLLRNPLRKKKIKFSRVKAAYPYSTGEQGEERHPYLIRLLSAGIWSDCSGVKITESVR